MNSEKFSVTSTQKKAVVGALIIALFGGAIFLKPYFSLVVVSIILAFLFNPVYKWLLNKTGKTGKSATLTFLFASFAIVIPVALIIFFSVRQIDSLISTTDFSALDQTIQELFDTLNKYFQNLNFKIDTAAVSNAIQDGIKSFGQALLSGLPGLFGSFLALITSFIIFIYVFLSLLKNQDKVIDLIHQINPLGKEIGVFYMDKMSAMTKATVRGQFIIAFCQGLESAIILSIAGMSDLFFFFLVLLTALSVIPMGAGIVTIPIGIILILTGDVWQGTLIIANHLLIVTNIDNVMRPKLVPKEARLDSALMILAVFCGIAYFGFLGIVLGPVIMIAIMTSIGVYLEVYKDIGIDKNVGDKTKRKSIYKRVGTSAKNLFSRSNNK